MQKDPHKGLQIPQKHILQQKNVVALKNLLYAGPLSLYCSLRTIIQL